jgi:hypothetical protein
MKFHELNELSVTTKRLKLLGASDTEREANIITIMGAFCCKKDDCEDTTPTTKEFPSQNTTKDVDKFPHTTPEVFVDVDTSISFNETPTLRQITVAVHNKRIQQHKQRAVSKKTDSVANNTTIAQDVTEQQEMNATKNVLDTVIAQDILEDIPKQKDRVSQNIPDTTITYVVTEQQDSVVTQNNTLDVTIQQDVLVLEQKDNVSQNIPDTTITHDLPEQKELNVTKNVLDTVIAQDIPKQKDNISQNIPDTTITHDLPEQQDCVVTQNNTLDVTITQDVVEQKNSVSQNTTSTTITQDITMQGMPEQKDKEVIPNSTQLQDSNDFGLKCADSFDNYLAGTNPSSLSSIPLPLPLPLPLPVAATTTVPTKNRHTRVPSQLPSPSVQKFIGLHSRGNAKKKRHLRRRSMAIIGTQSFAVQDIDFEISWAMFNYYAALGNPTRANSISLSQWRRFCTASQMMLSEKLPRAKIDLLFTAALQINDGSKNTLGEAMAAKASSPRLAKRLAKSANVSRKSNVQFKSELTFLQFFSALHDASQTLNEPMFIEKYLFGLANRLMHKLVSTSSTRRSSVKQLLQKQNKNNDSSAILTILSANRKILRKLFTFYHQRSKRFDFASLLAFAKDFDIVPTLASHSVLQKLMHDVKMSATNATEKTTKFVAQDELSIAEFELVFVGIAQINRKDSCSTHLNEDLIALLKHLEYGEGRKEMSSRGQREHRVSRFNSSEHFTIPKDLI